jgi:hypothetical protein
MHALTIDDHHRAKELATIHDSPGAAQAALRDYLVNHDYYHRPTQLTANHSAYELLSLSAGQPRVIGIATIETPAAAKFAPSATFATPEN